MSMKQTLSPSGSPRRGVATLVVLLLIAVAMAVSYAAMRSQGTAVRIQQNASLHALARQAAATGMAVAIKRMHTADWEGVDTALTGSLDAHQGYRVTFETGDPSLAPGHGDYADWPYRVTLLSTGTAADPEEPSRTATHRIRAVLRLVPRWLAEQPGDWDTMQQYTVYQAKKDSFEIDIPCRFQGRVRIQGQVKVAAKYPNQADAWKQYLGDLYRMWFDGHYPDYRPFDGPVDLPFDGQSYEHLSVLALDLNVKTNDSPVQEAAHVGSNPPSHSSYQIYPGGQVYDVPTLSSDLSNTVLEPDPVNNPLGIYHSGVSVTLGDNVTVRGSLFCTGDIRIQGTSVRFERVALPPLYGSDSLVCLPVAYSKNLTVKSGGTATIAGLLFVFNKFRIDKSPDTTEFAIVGRLITSRLFVKERQPWETVNWGEIYAAFEAQPEDVSQRVLYFPVWMKNQGYDPRPLITVKADTSPVTYHWKMPYNPIYVPHPKDGGLRWEVLEWKDVNPEE